MTFLRRYGIELGIYTLLTFAAAIIGVAGQPSLKDPPENHKAGYRIGYSPREARPLPLLMAAPPLPREKPEGSRNVEAVVAAPGGLGAEQTRIMLLKCASYYTIAAKVFPEEEATYRPMALAALKRAQSYPKGTQDWIDQENSVFVEVFEEYIAGPTSGLGLYDRYDEVCGKVVRPLLKPQNSEE